MAPRSTALAVLCAVAAVALAFVASGLLELPLPWFDPREGSWSFGHRPSTAAIDWYGRSLYALAAGALAFGLAALLSPRGGPPKAVETAALWIAALALAAAWATQAVLLYPRKPPAEPLPSGKSAPSSAHFWGLEGNTEVPPTRRQPK